MTLPFSARASPIASSDSSTALSMKSAGVDHYQIGRHCNYGYEVTLSAKMSENVLGINGRLGASKRYKTDLGNRIA